jgi:hypothetical protein
MKKDTKFKPGVSGNYKGRPKKEYCIPDMFRMVTSEPSPDEEKRTKLESIVRQVVDDALRGYRYAVELTFDRLEGRPRQTIVQETREPFTLEVVDDCDDDDVLIIE